MEFSSKYIEKAVEALSTFPGIGKKTALRMVLHLLKKPEDHTLKLTSALADLTDKVIRCKKCNHISDEEICPICQDSARDNEVICVVEDIQDVMAIEQTRHFRGKYHVLGGLISPVDGINPEDLFIEHLLKRVEVEEVKELIFALNANMEGETTAFYIVKRLKDSGLKFSTIARGIAIGSELEYTDELTLAKSISGRIPYQSEV